jgi:tRNA/rRNA methyltransferase
MANFGFSHLAVVAPYEAHWREAKSAIGAKDLLQNAKHTERLAEAVAECTLVVGTGTLEHRRPEQTVLALPELGPRIQKELEQGGRVALVFGPEKRGLTRDDLALCHLLVEIPTHPRQPSMNLGQAVAVCLYELAAREFRPVLDENVVGRPTLATSLSLSLRWGQKPADSNTTEAALACAHDLDLVAAVVAETMQAANYSPAAMQKANRHDLNLLLRRLTLTQRDARRILGLFRRILWRIRP